MLERRRITIEGTVQGVGFRPFVYRLALALGVSGWVSNSPQGVSIEAEADTGQIMEFIQRLQSDLPPHASIQQLETSLISPTGCTEFTIHHSDHHGAKTANVLPDLVICPDCLHEILDPTNRRYLYPFTNCTHCGPRFSIIQSLPYDRASTTMSGFGMCDDCRSEYENPLDRRFHAQPNACPVCGPQLALWDKDGNVIAERHEALLMAADAIRRGKIVAMKGLGGFHLMVDACNREAVSLLRQRKTRPDKPFAVMYPSLLQVPFDCELSSMDRDLLTSAAAPIVLLRRTTSAYVAQEVAPNNPYLGVMFPYTPLHVLLMQDLHFPIVATSGNRSGEPICTDEHEALNRLADIADVFLVHNRPIVRPVDDSVVQVAAGKIMVLRRARGYAPDPLPMPELEISLLAAGAHLKNTVAVAANHKATLSQHLGDLDTLETVTNYDQSIDSLKLLYEVEPKAVVCDLHPDYHSSHLAADYAQKHQLPLIKVQHHYAHVCACMAEHGLKAPLLGVAWDGTGFGTDGTIWGGEFLRITPQGYERVATLRPFPLPGGEASIREPRRTALGLLYELYGDNIPDTALAQLGFTTSELARLMTILRKGLNCPRTSSIGRLFDAIAALIGLRQKVSFEGQAAIDVEAAALKAQSTAQTPSAEACYPLPVTKGTGQGASVGLMIESKPMLQAILDDLVAKLTPEIIAAKFHNSLAVCISDIAREIGEPQIVLTGGCFQNRTLLARTVDRLNSDGFSVYWPNLYPPNDGGIALGQIAAAVRQNT